MVNQAYIVAIVGNIASFICGNALSWSSPILPKFNVTNVDDIPFGRCITDDESSWISSLLSLGAAFGPFLFGYLADRIGRKLTLCSLGAPFLISYLIMAFAKIVELYYVARFLIGVAIGGVFTVIPMYIGEISEDSNRGALGSAMNVLLTFGLLFSYSTGPYIPILPFSIMLAVIPGVFMVLFFFLAPESPQYYVAKGNFSAAEKSLKKLRGRDKIEDELNQIKTNIEQANNGTFLDLFKSKGLIKALIISLALVAFQQLSGINAVLFNAQDIFKAAGGGIKPEISSIIIGAVLFITSFVTPILVDRLGRKVLLLFSAIGMIITEVPLGVYFYLKEQQDVENISWLPVVSLIFYIFTYNCGFGPLPWVVMGELFPSNVKSVASSLTATFCWFISFLITKFFTSVADAIHMGPAFWVFAGSCVLALVFVFFIVIETKGKSFQEIQRILQN